MTIHEYNTIHPKAKEIKEDPWREDGELKGGWNGPKVTNLDESYTMKIMMMKDMKRNER